MRKDDMLNAVNMRKKIVLRAIEYLFLLLALCFVVGACLSACGATNANAASQARFTYYRDGDSSDVRYITDTKTGVQYLVVTNYGNGIAITPLLDKNGDIYQP